MTLEGGELLVGPSSNLTAPLRSGWLTLCVPKSIYVPVKPLCRPAGFQTSQGTWHLLKTQCPSKWLC